MAKEPAAGSFDLPHLQRIQRAIFQDVYDWAGDLREINISKGGMRFAMTSQLESSAADIFDRLRRDNHLQGLQQTDFARCAAEFLGDVNALHAFREGTGRTQREFFRELAARAGFHLDWSRTDSRDIVRASIASMVGDTKALAAILRRVSAPTNERGELVRDLRRDGQEERYRSGVRPAQQRDR